MADSCNTCGASVRRGSLQPSDHFDGCEWYVAPRSRTNRRGTSGEPAVPGSGRAGKAGKKKTPCSSKKAGKAPHIHLCKHDDGHSGSHECAEDNETW
jgi:hypothetical protein